MPQATGINEVCSAIEEAARLAGVPARPDSVRPIVSAFAEGLHEAGVVYSLSTRQDTPAELDFTLTVPTRSGDPYATALAHGFLTATGHPLDTLLADIQSRCTISEYLIDGGVAGGFNKIYAHFPQDVQDVAGLAELPSMPPALAQSLGLLARHGLSDVAMIGIDYPRRTVNLYFTQLSEQCRAPATILALHRELGLPAPGEAMLAFAARSFRIYTTLSWDSAGIERICYAPPPARGWEPAALPAPVPERVAHFVDHAPRAYPGEPIVIAAVKWAPEGEYLNLGPYFQLSPLMRQVISAVHNGKL
ncbi:aromatic prenyltransferase [Streptomyces sp. Je 1-369]|uniref:aromatic prenyltransferase n=1 Tax=Streptomyces sp. Je 1-369 TaxID=2966192 RepID=UPI0022868559|nr:aromatic prenyltransferase [Streptomyces sp. Je 1-369]WAL93121.1 aromatic prenyltransferase [Streptomyces sp. Je 1-369]WAL99859.1 aromatic prenyltransferase [Streptomyces sp. Je 1-369]